MRIAEEQFRGSYLDALRDLSRRLALIELVPYHSQSFGSGRIVDQLSSVEAVRTYARGPLAGAASRDEKTVIIARQEGAWGLPAHTPNVIVYKGSETRGANLGPNTKGGKAILARYGIAVRNDVIG